jgi:hypothetical protein
MNPFYSNLASLSVQPRFNGELPPQHDTLKIPLSVWLPMADAFGYVT